MTADMIGVASLSCIIYVIFRGIIFRLHLVSRTMASRKNLHVIFMHHFFNVGPKKFADFYWFLQLKNLIVNLKLE